MAGRPLFVFLLLATLTLVGCVQTLEAPTANPGVIASNMGQYPHHMANVADRTFINYGGAEPTVLVNKVTGAILEGDSTGVHRLNTTSNIWEDVTPIFIPGTVNTTLVSGGISDGWALAQDPSGRVYTSTTDGPFVNVASTTDDGTTWQFLTGLVVRADGISDRPWLATNGVGKVAVIVNAPFGEACSYSTDSGVTWTTFSRLNTGTPNAGSATFDSGSHLYFATSGLMQRWDGTCFPGALLTKSIPAQGAQILTQMGVDDNDYLYVAQPKSDNSKIQLIGYQGFGPLATTKTLDVSLSNLSSNTFAAIAVEHDHIAVSWYGSTSSGDPSNSAFSGTWNVYVAQIRGFWNATPDVQVTQITSTGNHAGWFCMGGTGCGVSSGSNDPRDMLDYQGVTFDTSHNVHMVYGKDDLTNNNWGVFYAKVTAS